MKSIFHPAGERGHANFGWLDSHHSFSFGRWYDPGKIHFGALRVLNDDTVRAGAGFGTHPHDNMEIVSIPLSGFLKHRDSTGTDGLIQTGDVQIMSAGSGIEHSEYNGSKTDAVEFLQIWVYPKLADIKPRYAQKSFDEAGRKQQWQVVVSPDADSTGVSINQDAVFSLAALEAGTSLKYQKHFENNGVYFFLLEGTVNINGQELQRRDGFGVWNTDDITVTAGTAAKVLAIEVPMLTEADLN
ncbi:pirin family protein [Flavihumibacter petaseus]|uniref:Putative quercetin 2,3-dioxygenase n=1 Tax=Flavihumibacter petaseus NBRC 106054 TaxID=1220578 RepID=A0A0E9MVE4_9BACT|nr:pirin family protein [Flavihumibacter petaseus]GAO41732.1 putative quercetin 2,3-dioxygenase [Flavihumibacter petaseus NBRC 106054]